MHAFYLYIDRIMFKCGAVLLKMVECLATATAVTATAVTAATTIAAAIVCLFCLCYLQINFIYCRNNT